MRVKQVFNRCQVVIEDEILTVPLPGYSPRFWGDEAVLARGVSELRSQGYTSIGSLFEPEEIAGVRALIDESVLGHRQGITVDWSDRVEYWRILNPLRLDPLLLKVAVHPLALALIERYFGRSPYLSDVDMRRIPPKDMNLLEKKGYSSSNWHRDTRGRQLKMMIYLTDVGEADSNFSLLPATHIGAYRRKKGFMESRLSDAEVNAMPTKSLEWYGVAGDAMIFDTNLIHRLRRKPTARVRDTITFYYTPGQSLWRLDLDDTTLAGQSKEVRAIFGDPAWPFRRSDV